MNSATCVIGPIDVDTLNLCHVQLKREIKIIPSIIGLLYIASSQEVRGRNPH
jgi:hypothetical protein